MSDIKDFYSRIDKIMEQDDKKLEIYRGELREKNIKFRKMLAVFDKHADSLQDEIIAPMIKYLASQFENTAKPVIQEEENYRHKIFLRFLNSEDFSCTADINVMIVHCDLVDFLKIKFDYIILPSYLTDRYKFSDEIQISMDEKSSQVVGAFIQSCIETFMKNYLLTRNI